MKTHSRLLLVILLSILLPSCEKPEAPHIRRALEQRELVFQRADADFRREDPERDKFIAKELAQIDLSNCPNDFRSAFNANAFAWKKSAETGSGNLAAQQIGNTQMSLIMAAGEYNVSMPSGPIATPAAAVAAAASPIKRNGELTRPLATEILNQHLTRTPASELGFRADAMQKAKTEGLIEPEGSILPAYKLTQKGIELFQPAFGETPSLNYDRLNKRLSLHLTTATVVEQVDQVTGIASHPLGQGISEVEFETRFNFSQRMTPIVSYLFTGMKRKATLKKYDDGWRVAGIE